MIIKSLNMSDENEVLRWDSFVKNHGRLYHDFRWAKILQSVYSFEPVYLYGEEDGEFVSALPLFYVKKLFGGNELVSVPHIEAAGLVNTESFRMYLDYIFDNLKGNSLKIMQFMEPIGDLAANTSEVIIIKELPSTTAEIIDSVPTKRKRNYMRGALKKPYELVIGNDSKLLLDFYALYLDRMRSFGTPPHSFKFLNAIRETFADDCMIIAARDSSGVLVGAMLCVGFTNVLDCLYLVVATEHLQSLAGYFIEYHVMAYAIANGYSSLNRGRSENKGSNYDYKVSLGGKPIPLYRYKFELTSDGYRCVEERTAKEKFRFQAKIWAKFPPLITDNIGPLIRKWVY